MSVRWGHSALGSRPDAHSRPCPQRCVSSTAPLGLSGHPREAEGTALSSQGPRAASPEHASALSSPQPRPPGSPTHAALNGFSEAMAREDEPLARRAERRLFHARALLRPWGELIRLGQWACAALRSSPTRGCTEIQARAQEGPPGYQGGADS